MLVSCVLFCVILCPAFLQYHCFSLLALQGTVRTDACAALQKV